MVLAENTWELGSVISWVFCSLPPVMLRKNALVRRSLSPSRGIADGARFWPQQQWAGWLTPPLVSSGSWIPSPQQRSHRRCGSWNLWAGMRMCRMCERRHCVVDVTEHLPPTPQMKQIMEGSAWGLEVAGWAHSGLGD